jgi:hypothetical protein
MNHCTAQNCRYPTSHTIDAHRCGACRKFGHSAPQCKKISPLPTKEYCTVKFCTFPQSHKTCAHFCYYCSDIHDEKHCEKYKSNDIIKGVKDKAHKILGRIDNQIYCEVYGGMGCVYMAKRDSVLDYIQLFFMHSDAWGQYGEESSDVPKMEKFLSGYVKITPPN